MNTEFWKTTTKLLTGMVSRLKYISLITFITLIIGGGIWSIFCEPSTTAIVLYWLITIVFTPSILVIYNILAVRLILQSTLEKNKLDRLQNIENLIKDFTLIKTLDTMNLSDIRDKQTADLIDEIKNNINTKEGKLLKNQLLKSKNYIRYEYDSRTSEKD